MMNGFENIIEGIGNEVLWSVSGIISFTLGSYFMYQRFQNSGLFGGRSPSSPLSPGVGGQSVERRPPRHFGHDQQCPVCLVEPRYPVETNCGHVFCAECVITYWRHGNWIGAIKCPVCRQTVTVLLQCFSDTDREDSEVTDRLLHDINDYNRHFSGEQRSWLEYFWDLPTLLRHAGSEFFSVGGLMYMFRLRIFLCFVAAVLYLASPLDMIPEAVFGVLGLLDDMFVVLLLAIYVTVIYRRFLATRWQNA